MMVSVVLYGTKFCPYCIAARMLLNKKGIIFEDIAVDNDGELRATVSEKSGQHTVPQIWIGDQFIGGYTELNKLALAGDLDQLLNFDSTRNSDGI